MHSLASPLACSSSRNCYRFHLIGGSVPLPSYTAASQMDDSPMVADTLLKNATLPDISKSFLTGERSGQFIERATFDGGTIRAYGPSSRLAEISRKKKLCHWGPVSQRTSLSRPQRSDPHATLPDISDISSTRERSDQFIGVLLSKVERSELMTGERSDQFTGSAAFGV